MMNAKTVIIILFSLLAALLALRVYKAVTRPPAPEPVQARAPVSKEIKEEPEPRKTFSGAVPKGKRIVSIKVDEVSGATRALAPNDRVDVIAVTNISGTRGGKIARVILQNVPVYDTAESDAPKGLTDRKSRKKKSWTLQLVVSLSQAVTLSTMDEAAGLRLVLRNPGDTATEPAAPIVYTPEGGITKDGFTGTAFSRQIKPGMRAITLNINRENSICGRLNPGDRVDVVVSSKMAAFETEEGNMAEGSTGRVFDTRQSAKILLQDVMVIATDQPRNPLPGIQDTAKKTDRVTKVSLMVTPRQAEKIAVIMDTAKSAALRLILRNPRDREKVWTPGEMLQDQVLGEKRSFVTVETVKGGKVYPRKFYND